MARGQGWDLEGFFLNGTILSMVGGYDFVNGKKNLYSGDVFIDADGDAIYGDIHNNSTKGNQVVSETNNYEYVLDLDFETFTYDVYKLGEDSRTVTSYEEKNQGSNPWRYYDGGEYVTSGSLFYNTGYSDADVGFLGGSHNIVSNMDLSFLGGNVDFIAHFTMQCGNDNLMGAGTTATPEPATMALLGAGLIGLAAFRRRQLAN